MSRFARLTDPKRLAAAFGLGALVSVVIVPATAMAAAGEASEYYEEALGFFHKGDYRSAIVQLKNLLQANPDDPTARLLIGRAYIGVGDGAAAEKEILRARSGGTNETLILKPLARAYFLQRKYDDILDGIRPTGVDPELDSAILVIHGQVHIARRDLDLAERVYDEAALLQPDATTPVLGLAQVMLGRGRFIEADRLVDRAIALAPDDAEVWYVKGEIQRVKGELAAAIGHYDRAIELEARYLAARMGRAASLIDLGRHRQALADVEFVRSVAPNEPQANYFYALILASTGEMTKAREALRDAGLFLQNFSLAMIKDDAPTLLLAGVVNYVQEKFDSAFTYLERYVEIAPVHAGARKLLGTLLMKRGEAERAIGVLGPVLELTPDDPQVYSLLGEAFALAGRNSEATAMFEKAIVLLPDHASLRTRLAMVRFSSGQGEAAKKDLESALALDPNAFQAGVLLGLVDLRAGRFDEALTTIRELIKRRPESPIALNMAGVAQLGLSDEPAARASFERAVELDAGYLPAQYNLARLEHRQGHTALARDHYRAILDHDPTETQAMIELAEIAEGEGAFREAITWLEKVRSHTPDAIEPQVALITDYIRAEKPRAALAVAHELEERVPDSPAVLEALGRAELAVGQTADAERTFRRFAEIAKDSPERLFYAARLQLSAGDEEGARASLEQAVELDPASLPAQAALIDLDARAGHIDAGLERATTLRRAQPDSAVPDMLTGDLLMSGRRYEEATKAYAAGWKKAESSALAIRLYRSRHAAGAGDAALPPLEEWVAGHPDDLAARRLLAAAYMKAGRIGTAIEQHERLLGEISDDAAILNNLAWLYQLRGDPRAVSYAEKAYALAPEEAATLDTLGWILVQRGDPARGLKYLRNAYSRAPREALLRYHLGVALSELGRTDEARQELKGALRLDGTFSGAAEARALLNRLSGG